jgi:hypothetical protein
MLFLGSVALCTVDGLQSVKHMFLRKSCVLRAVRDAPSTEAAVIFALVLRDIGRGRLCGFNQFYSSDV